MQDGSTQERSSPAEVPPQGSESGGGKKKRSLKKMLTPKKLKNMFSKKG